MIKYMKVFAETIDAMSMQKSALDREASPQNGRSVLRKAAGGIGSDGLDAGREL